ncbi:LacI family DNA-binding transcriptional regulator [Actinomadura montaniterrae]|nr:LacI family DNA-binding transcriptional regulator [Actinomadura montaniterrae]
MSGRARRVTAADEAREAGVSAATVSYVVNDKPAQTIPPETRERVLAAATRLGYAPYAPARTLALGASNLVLFAHRAPIVPPTYARYLEALADGLHEHGLDLVWQLGYDPSAGARHPAAGLSDLGVDVPAHAAVVGIDDHPLAALYTPSLTTISLDDPPPARPTSSAASPPPAPAPPSRRPPRSRRHASSSEPRPDPSRSGGWLCSYVRNVRHRGARGCHYAMRCWRCSTRGR